MINLQYPLLALDTSGLAASVALATIDQTHCALGAAHRGHSQSVLGLAQELLAGAQVDRTALKSLVLVHGPGSFTGLRVAVSIAQGIALGADCRVYPVNALLASAWHATLDLQRNQNMLVLVAQDARLNEIYYAAYRWIDDQFLELTELCLGGEGQVLRWLEQLEQLTGSEVVVAAGSAWAVFPLLAQLAAQKTWLIRAQASARADAALAAVLHSTQGQVTPLQHLEALQPVYLRNKVALTSSEQQALRWRKQFSSLHALTVEAAPGLAELESRLQPVSWSVGSFVDAVQTGCIVQGLRPIHEPEALAAYFVLLPVLDEMQLLTIGVDLPWQGHGLGRWLLEQAIVISKVRGAASILLEVRKSNAPARHLYTSLGFQLIGERKAYYATATDSREDALVMRLELTVHG